jgi:hypothetical protein
MGTKHWGPHFPDARQPGVKHWSIHFPDRDTNPALFPAYGPGGIATFVPEFKGEFTLKLSWVTDIIKARSGKEQRIATIQAPKQSYEGDVHLEAQDARSLRAALARFSAAGATYLLGLPHESMSLVADASGTNVFVSSSGGINLCDWREIGQRVAVRDTEGNYVEATIQLVNGGTITLDKSVGSVGRYGGEIMPLMPVFLEQQQSFNRFSTDTEIWQLSARAARFTWALPHYSLNFSDVCSSAELAGATVMAANGGVTQLRFGLQNTGGGHGFLSPYGQFVTFYYEPGVTTVGDLRDALGLTSFLRLTGSYNPADVLQNDAAFVLTLLQSGGSGFIGRGASIMSYAGSPVWDPVIQHEGSVGDTVMSLTEIIDMNGAPYVIRTADYADWGRQVRIKRTTRTEFQWVKLFLWTVYGRQKSFWLPTWRNDLVYDSHSGSTVTINNDSDIMAWWPAQRQHVQIRQTDGTLTYTEVLDVVDNGDGTSDLTIDMTLSGTAINRISWLERCHFESDDFEITFKGQEFSMEAIARAVQR